MDGRPGSAGPVMNDIPQSDRLGEFLHPRENEFLFGHEAAEARMLETIASGKLHHAFIISGPPGIGKATFAYRLARFLFSVGLNGGGGSASLHVPSNDPVFRRVASGGHADLLTLKRPWDEKTKRFKRDLTVEEMRRVGPFFGKMAAEGGWRIAIIDKADDMNIAAANAVLKTLEEPPDNSLILLVANAPGKLLPTIRSRCQSLALQPLNDANVLRAIQSVQSGDPLALNEEEIAVVAALSEGSVGRALELAAGGGFAHYQGLCEMLFALPAVDVKKLEALAGQFAGVRGAAGWPIFRDLFLDMLARFARAAATGEVGREVLAGEAGSILSLAQRVGAPKLVDLWEEARDLFERVDAVNLDRRHAIMSIFYRIEAAALSAPSAA